MNKINFKTNNVIMEYSYDVCEVVECHARSSKIVEVTNPLERYHNVCAECYNKINKG
jgi:hypothetical protein